MLARIIYGMLGVIGGLIVTIKAQEVVGFTGRIEWAERNLGNAGTFNFIRIVGIFLTIFFFLYMVGLAGVVYSEIVGFLFSIIGSAG